MRVENYRLPKADTERAALAAKVTIGADGFHLLRAALDPEAPEAVRLAPAIAVLRQVWVQHPARRNGGAGGSAATRPLRRA